MSDYIHPPLNQTHIDALTQRIAHTEQHTLPLIERCKTCDMPVSEHESVSRSQLETMRKIKAVFAPNHA